MKTFKLLDEQTEEEYRLDHNYLIIFTRDEGDGMIEVVCMRSLSTEDPASADHLMAIIQMAMEALAEPAVSIVRHFGGAFDNPIIKLILVSLGGYAKVIGEEIKSGDKHESSG